MRTTRSTSVVVPSNNPESSAAPSRPAPSVRSQIITRSISKKRARRKYLPIPDRSSSSVRQHRRPSAYLYRAKPGEPKGYPRIDPNLKVTHGTYPRLTDELREEALRKLGVIFRGQSRPPLTAHHFQQAEEKAKQEKALALAMNSVAEHIKLQQQDLISLLSVNRMVHNNLVGAFYLWRTRYHNVEHIDFTSAKGIEDKHLKLLKTKEKVVGSLEYLESLNLDSCRGISDRGVKDVLSTCPRLQKFSIGNNLRVTDSCIKFLVENCKCLTDLNLSGCKNLTDKSLVTIKNACHGLESLNIARCERVTDAGVIAVAQGCPSLKFLSLSEIPGVTDKCLETLSELCSNTLTTLDVDGCTGVQRSSQLQLLQLFPNLQ